MFLNIGTFTLIKWPKMKWNHEPSKRIVIFVIAAVVVVFGETFEMDARLNVKSICGYWTFLYRAK